MADFVFNKWVPKPWGGETIVVNCPLYCSKLLLFKKGKSCSFQYHIKKTETLYVISGSVLVRVSENDCIDYNGKFNINLASFINLQPGDHFHIEPGYRHMVTANLDSVVLETSTQHNDNDTIRVFDPNARL